MSKYVIECPDCGSYVEVGTGLFAKKKVKCTCGHVINANTDKMTSKVCPHCGNTVIYDQSKGESAVCPVCHEKINTSADKSALVKLSFKETTLLDVNGNASLESMISNKLLNLLSYSV